MAPTAQNNKGSYSDFNLNFMWGCKRVSPGCDRCYIDRYAHWYASRKLKEAGTKETFDGNPLYFDEKARLTDLNRQPHNSVIFVNGLSDTFATFVTDEQRERWLGHMEAHPQYQFMLCTKRTGQMELFFRSHKVPPNVWVGTTIEDKERLFRL